MQSAEKSDILISTGINKHSSKYITAKHIRLLCDISACLFICLILNYRETAGVEIISILFFSVMTFLYAYLDSRNISIIVLWAMAFYGFCLLSNLWQDATPGLVSMSTTLVKMLLLVTMMSIYMESAREVDVILNSVLFGAALLFIRLLISTPFSEWGSERLGRLIGMNANTVGMTFAHSSVICLYYSNKKPAYIILAIAFGTVSLFSGSRKAFVLLLIALAMTFVNRLKKPSNVLYVIPFGIFFYGIVYMSMNNPALYHVLGRRIAGFMNLLSGEGKVDASTINRMEMIEIGVELFKDRMIIGYGIDSYRYLGKFRLYSHNNYIELLVNYGLVGTILYYTMPVTILFSSMVLWLKRKREIIIALMLSVNMLVIDYGGVTHYTTITLILLVVAFRSITICMNSDIKDNKNC